MRRATSLPITWAADHGQRFALGRVDLAGHDRAARLVLRHARARPGRSAGRRPASARRWRSSSAPPPAPSARRARAPARRARRAPRSGWRRSGTAGRCRRASSAATRAPNCGCVLSPVPTAVPPIASSCSGGRPRAIACSAWSSCATQPEISWPSVSGVASCRWVRPILTMSAKAARLVGERAAQRRAGPAAGRWRSPSTAATCIAVGKTSLDDWPQVDVVVRVHAGAPRRARRPAARDARLASTSFMFMLVCVPEPVCQTESGNSPACAPASTSSAARAMASASGASSRPSSRVDARRDALDARQRHQQRLAACARSEMRKCSSERCVCAPHSALGGHLDVAEGVVFDSSGGHGISSMATLMPSSEQS